VEGFEDTIDATVTPNLKDLSDEEFESLLSLFRLCDLDQDGYLTIYEFRRAFLRLTKKEIQDEFWKLDIDNRGFIS
jgi:hypothetical protein